MHLKKIFAKGIFGIGATALLSGPSVALGSIQNRNLYPLGDMEAFMGNTGTALEGSAGNAYYNPAGLIFTKSSEVTLAGNSYVYSDFHSDEADMVNGYAVPVDNLGFNSVPSTFVASFKTENYAFAFSVFTPTSNTSSSRQTVANSLEQINRVNLNDDEETWVGLSVARNLSDHVAFGMTLFGMRIAATDTNFFNSTAGGSTTSIDASQVYTNSSILAGSLEAGLMFTGPKYFDFGVRIQSPSVKISGKIDSYSTATALNNTVNVLDLNGADANYVWPMDITLGVAFKPRAHLKFLADLSVQSSESYDTSSNTLIDATVNTVLTPRINVGGEVQLSSSFDLGFGAFYNPSAAPPVQLAGQVAEDFYGTTAGCHFNTGAARFGLGGSYTWGEGQRMVVNATAPEAVSSKVMALLLNSSVAF